MTIHLSISNTTDYNNLTNRREKDSTKWAIPSRIKMSSIIILIRKRVLFTSLIRIVILLLVFGKIGVRIK